jgi:AraC-like DNA-binding protein
MNQLPTQRTRTKPGHSLDSSHRSGAIASQNGQFAVIRHPGVVLSLKFLLEHCYEPVDIWDVVNASGMSRRGFHEAFVKCLGVQPGQFLRDLRIQRAKQLLVESNQKQEVVALMCGYQSANSFWVAFRQATGFRLNNSGNRPTAGRWRNQLSHSAGFQPLFRPRQNTDSNETPIFQSFRQNRQITELTDMR